MNWPRMLDALSRIPHDLSIHILMVVIALAISIAISIPVGVLLTRPRYKKWGIVVMNILNVCQSFPGMAIIALAMPILGLGLKPAITALIIQALLPIARNTIAGLNGVDPGIKEAAKGMGMTPKRVLTEVEVPLAMPVILAGIRTSAVLVVSMGTLAAYIGGGGLGDLIIAGLNMLWVEFLLVGAGFGALLAIAFDRGLRYVEDRLTPPGFSSI
ncbi:MAG: ABC transporter permease [Syntrophaceticus sp.]|nr:ABC transporter permease [Syntrophaceticus sp.]MDD3315734.1 ABC transporter permease [Syntrophaceticus sp.]MDD4783578.1 ABC transporter permease [Syntrophaceticus sp.]HBG23132.1 choline ABC transporter permease [Peptococcaceae bacterium]